MWSWWMQRERWRNVGFAVGGRWRRSVGIVELTWEPGASVALVARANGVNANQVFKWRRALERGELVDPAAASTALLPVTLSASRETSIETREVGAKPQPTAGGAIHIEFPGRATISVECGADATLLRSILEILCK